MDRLAAMEAFVVVVDTGSFSAAARRLNVGQPAVSKMVAQLEDRLGVKLLLRTTRGLTATEAGLNYYERARRSIEEADEAELSARTAGSSLTGRLRICAAVTFARIHLIPRLPEFLARHPELEMDVVLDDRNIDLVQEGIDVALRMGRLVDSTLTARRIASCPHAVLATPSYFARSGEVEWAVARQCCRGGARRRPRQRRPCDRLGMDVRARNRGWRRQGRPEGLGAAADRSLGRALGNDFAVMKSRADTLNGQFR
jgi:DNA-binding transcriptional LysR family regulator